MMRLHDSDNARVYRAVRSRDGRLVVVKQYKFDFSSVDKAVAGNFLKGFERIHRLRCDGLVRTYDMGIRDHRLYQVMEYLPGGTLKQRLKDDTEDNIERAIFWFRQITDALGVLHKAGFVHRDLKTANVMFRDDSPILIDYGIEKSLMLETGLIQENEIYCTPYYMSPERVVGYPCDRRCDLYSLGVIFYELLMRKKPFDGENLVSLIQQHVHAQIPTLPKHLQAYQGLLNGLLAKSPKNRIGSTDAVLASLLAIGV